MAARSRPPHLLYVAWGFPPARSGGVYRALATANAFARAGWRVTVLSAEREAFERYTGTDTSLEQHVHARVRVVRLPFTWPLLDTDIRSYSWLRAHAPQRWQQRQLHRETAHFPEPGYGPWRRPLERAAARIHAQDPVDLVVATANPNVDFTAAWELHRRFDVPYVMDYRDAWLLDVFEGDMLHAEDSSAARWERRLVASAHEVWFVNEPIRAWHAARYPAAAARMHVVANGFDPELAPSAPLTAITSSNASTSTATTYEAPTTPTQRTAADAVPDCAPGSGRPLTYGYLGTVSLKVPLLELIAGWRLARERDEVTARSRIHLHGYLGYYSTPRAELVKWIGDAAPDDVAYRGPAAKTDVAAVYSSFDVLLLALGAGRYVTSGKVYEYLATGLPIVSVHDPDNAASDVLRSYPLHFPVTDLGPAAVADALIRAGAAAVRGDAGVRAECLRYASTFTRDRQLLPRVDALTTALAPGFDESMLLDLSDAQVGQSPSELVAAGADQDPVR